jgi:multiple sugar transport system ATP-binding protein
LAFVDIGAYGVPLDEPGADPAATTGSRLSKVAQVFRRGSRAEEPAQPDGGGVATAVLEPRARHYRIRAELAVRLPPYPNLRTGDQLNVSVRLEQLHFFDNYGRRIDVGWH